MPRKEISIAIEKIRLDNYGIFRDKVSDADYSLVKDIPNIDLSAIKIEDSSPLTEKSIAGVNFRKVYGATVVAIKRHKEIIEHPDPNEIFKQGDIVYVLGKPEQIAYLVDLFSIKSAS